MEAKSTINDHIKFIATEDTQRVKVLRIAPSKGWVPLKVGELWEYRELVYFLIWRNVKIRYKQTALGSSLGYHPAVYDDAGL